jgi:hypothetical protein
MVFACLSPRPYMTTGLCFLRGAGSCGRIA